MWIQIIAPLVATILVLHILVGENGVRIENVENGVIENGVRYRLESQEPAH